MAKASDNIFPKIIEAMQTADPAAPTDSSWKIYAKAGGIYARSSNAVVGAFGSSGAAAVGNLWTMNKSSSQTLTSATDTLVTFDTTVINGGGSVIDLANEQFVAPATGFYVAFCVWLWEATTPASDSPAIAVYVNGSATVVARCRVPGNSFAAAQGANGVFPLTLTSGDTVKMYINPGTATPTARGNAAAQIATTFSLLRVT